MRPSVSDTCKSDSSKSGTIIPVVVINRVEDAVPLASILVENGLANVEVTLRTPAALKAIEAIAKEVPDCIIGVGSILTPEQLRQAQEAGGHFGVSPGTSPALLAALGESDWPFLPGASTLSEILTLRDVGFDEQKLFPASIVGGVNFLKAVAGPVADISFCPTGGVKPDNATDYLALGNVFAVGGTWIAPTDLVRKQAWDQIASNAAAAAAL